MRVAPENFRSRRRLGGSSRYDIGIYCINAARAAFAAEPTEVFATPLARRDQRFREVPETVSVLMKRGPLLPPKGEIATRRRTARTPSAWVIPEILR